MMNKRLYRPLGVAAIIIIFVLAAALLASTSTGTAATAPVSDEGQPVDPTVSPFEANRILLPKSTAAYNGVSVPDTTLYAPYLLDGTSSLRVYNTSPTLTTTVYAILIHESTEHIISTTLSPGAVGEIQPSIVATGTELMALLTATHPIAAVVNDFGINREIATSYAAMSASLGQKDLLLVDVLYEPGDSWVTKPVVQNVGTAPTSVQVVYTRTNAVTTTNWVDDSVTNLAPGESRILDLEEAELPENFIGIATVHADQPLLAVVHNSNPRNAHIFREPLFGAGNLQAPSLYFPMLAYQFQNWNNSDIQVVNASATPADFDIQIHDTTVEKSIDAWQAKHFPQDPKRPGGEIITSPQGVPVSGHVLDAQFLRSLVWLVGNLPADSIASYSTPLTGTRTVYFPFADQGDDFTANIFVQNLGESSAAITVTYHNISGTFNTFIKTPIPPLGMDYYRAESDLPTVQNFIGGVVVQADQPVAAVAVLAGRLLLDKEAFLPLVFKSR